MRKTKEQKEREELEDKLYALWAESGLWRRYNFYDWLDELSKILKEHKSVE